MHSKRLSEIVRVPQGQRFAVLAEGLRLLADNVTVLDADFTQLVEQRRGRGAAVLQSFADEEAAKVMILLDLARCGWNDHTAVNRCLRNFYQHLSRGLYVRVYDGNPANLAEVRGYVETLQQQFRLDGPLEAGSIFGNEVLTEREERLYVDWIEDEHGERRWTGPASAIEDAPFDSPPVRSRIIEVVSVLSNLSVLTEEGLEATRAAWEGVTVQGSMRWEGVYALNKQAITNLMGAGSEYDKEDIADLQFIFEHWTFPLYTLDLFRMKVDLAKLRQERDHRLVQDLGIADEFG